MTFPSICQASLNLTSVHFTMYKFYLDYEDTIKIPKYNFLVFIIPDIPVLTIRAEKKYVHKCYEIQPDASECVTETRKGPTKEEKDTLTASMSLIIIYGDLSYGSHSFLYISMIKY